MHSIPFVLVNLLAWTLSYVAAAPAIADDNDWPTFRGAQRTAIAPDKNLLTSWPKSGPTLIWETAGAGRGYASIAVAGDKLFTLGDGLSAKEDEDEYLSAYDRATGKQLWATKTGPAWKEMQPDWHNSRSTPTVDNDMVYVITPKGVLVACQVADGTERWRKDLVGELGGKKDDPWGYSESVLIDGDHLVCTPGGDKATMVALNKLTGELVWQAAREGDIGAGHASIVISEVGSTRVYVQTTGSGAIGVSAKDGSVLWSYPIDKTTAVIPTPIVREDLVFFTAGYNRGGALLQQIAGADGSEGAVTIKEIYGLKPKLNNRHGGVILIGDYLYGDTDDNGTPFCAELMTGEIKWKGRGPGKKSVAMIGCGQMLFMQFQDGEIALAKADPSAYSVVSHFTIPDTGDRPSWAHPTIANGRLFVRSQDKMYCYDLVTAAPETETASATTSAAAAASSAAAAPMQADPAAMTSTSNSDGGEMFLNGDFANGNEHWEVELTQEGSAKVANNKEGPEGAAALRVEVTAVPEESWMIQLHQRGLTIEENKSYVLTFWMRSNQTEKCKVVCMQNHEPWESSTGQDIYVSDRWKMQQFKFDGPWDDDNARITFTNLGTEVGRVFEFAECSLKIDAQKK